MIFSSSSHFSPFCSTLGIFTLSCVFIMLTGVSFGQVASSIDGHVVDSSGGNIPDASVTITSSALGTTRQTRTDGKGEFLVQGLPPGFYSIKISSPGFATQEVRAAEVLVNQPLTPTVKLAIATANTEMTVTSEAPMLETTTSSTGAIITPRQIEDMPINGRNYLDLMQLVPGVAVNRQANTGSDAAPRFSANVAAMPTFSSTACQTTTI